MKAISLGTAMWGWSVDKNEAFSILDYFYDEGERQVDAANNYPINGNELDYRKSALFLAEWCKTRDVHDLKITFKVGSTTNTNSPDYDLSREHMHAQYNWSRENFGENLNCIMIHWDNRNKKEDINESCQYLHELQRINIEVGLSGIKYPDIYRQSLADNGLVGMNVQAKHNFLFSGFSHYKELDVLRPKYWAYGISVSGLKLSAKEYTKSSYVTLVRSDDYHKDMLLKGAKEILNKIIKENNQFSNLYHIAIAYAEKDDLLHGYMVAPSSLEQMQDIIKFRNSVNFLNLDLPQKNAF